MYRCIRGKPIRQIEFTEITAKSGRYKNRRVCDNIFCFDTETTSDFIVNGVPRVFDYDNPDVCRQAIKHSLVYVWQFSIDNNVYIGRTLEDFEELLIELNAYCDVVKIVYVHNLSFDFCFLQNILSFDDVFARKPRHPMTARVNYFNVEFRCSYVLTNMSLDEWGKSQKLFFQKAVGKLDYNNKLRTPKTPLSESEIMYCVNDVLTMYCGLKNYRDKYGTIYNIPMTHTGEMRRECMDVMKDEIGYCLKVSEVNPRTLKEYARECYAFIGGTVLCNWLYKNRTINNVASYDISSSYPWVLISCLFPMSPFYLCNKNYERYMNNPKYLYIVKFTAENVESKLNCHFLSKSKAIRTAGAESDNGRLVRAKKIEYILTSVDYELFLQCYDADNITFIEFYWTKAGYLNNTYRRFILSLYSDKTTLKGVEGQEKNYMLKKQYINSCYGDAVTKIFSDDIKYSAGEWDKTDLNEETFIKKLKTQDKKKYKNYKAFAHGVFCTAWARKRLWDGILSECEKDGLKLDEKMVYCDTDSLKVVDYHGAFFDEENARVFKRHEELAEELNVDISLFRPVDVKGKAHPIGVYEYEGTYTKFRSLGCKQYLVEENGELKLTCAGISKKAVKCFKTVDDFKIDTELTEKMLKECGAEKLIPTYATGAIEYPVVKYPDGYICKYKYGINLMPTTFNLSIAPADLALLFGEVKDKLSKFYYN